MSLLDGAAFHGCLLKDARSIRNEILLRTRTGELSGSGAFYTTDSVQFACNRALENRGTLFDVDESAGRRTRPPASLSFEGQRILPVFTGSFFKRTTTLGNSCTTTPPEKMFGFRYPEDWDTADVVEGPISKTANAANLKNYADVCSYLNGKQTAYCTIPDVCSYQNGKQTTYCTTPATHSIHRALAEKAILLAQGFHVDRPM